MQTTLVIDTGQDVVGIYSVEECSFVVYRGNEIPIAIQRIQTADEIVTFNGKCRDLRDLGRFAGIDADLPINGKHTDMRSICWSDRIWGGDLFSTYMSHFWDRPAFPNTYEGSCHCDVYMTHKLWELLKQGKLRILDGHRVAPAA